MLLGYNGISSQFAIKGALSRKGGLRLMSPVYSPFIMCSCGKKVHCHGIHLQNERSVGKDEVNF